MGNKGGKEKISPEARAKAEEVMKPFLQGYPGIIDDPSKCRNADFYLRDTYYKYNGQEFTLSAILRRLQNDPASLYHKDAVWWPTFVFPTRDPFPPNSDETVMHPLQIHEVRAITSNASSFLVFKQMVTAFLLSWGFYCDLLGPSPRIELHKDAYSRYAEKATHDPSTPRHITRVLKCMGELGLEYIKPQFVLALIIATYRGEKKWLSLRESLVLYWAPCLRSAKAREGAMNLIKWYEDHVDGKAPAPPMNVEWAKAEVDEDVAAQPWATGTSKAFFATHDFRLESQLNTAGEPQAAKSTAPTVNGVKGQTTSTTSSMESTSAPVPTLIEEDPQESGIIDESPSAVGTTSHPVQQARPRAATTSAVTLPPFVDKTRAPPALTGAYVAPLNDGAQKIFFDFPTTPVSRAPSTTLKGCTLAVLVGSFAPDLERLVVAAVHQLAAETAATVDTTSATIGSAIEAAAKVGNQTVLYFVPPDVVVNAIALRLRERIAAERKFLPPSTVSVCATSPAFLGAALRAPSRNAACILRDYVVVRDPLPSPLSRVVPLVAAAA